MEIFLVALAFATLVMMGKAAREVFLLREDVAALDASRLAGRALGVASGFYAPPQMGPGFPRSAFLKPFWTDARPFLGFASPPPSSPPVAQPRDLTREAQSGSAWTPQTWGLVQAGLERRQRFISQNAPSQN